MVVLQDVRVQRRDARSDRRVVKDAVADPNQSTREMDDDVTKPSPPNATIAIARTPRQRDSTRLSGGVRVAAMTEDMTPPFAVARPVVSNRPVCVAPWIDLDVRAAAAVTRPGRKLLA